MLKNLSVLFILFFLASEISIAQPAIPKNVDVLYQQLGLCKTDTGRVNLLIKICRYDNANSAKQLSLLDSTLAVAGRAKKLSEKIGYPEGIGLAYQLMAQAWCNKKDFKRSDELIKKAVAIFLNNNLYRDAAEAYLNMEEFYLSAGGKDYQIMAGYYEQARPLFHQAAAYDREGATLSVLGDFYQVMDKLDLSLARLNDAITAYKKGNYRYLQYTYDLLGMVNTGKSRYNEGLKYGLLAVKAVEETKDTSMLVCTIYNRLAITYFLANKVPQARIWFEKALAVAKRYHDAGSVRIVLNGLIEVLLSEDKPAEALALLKDIQVKYPDPPTSSHKWMNATFIGIYTDMKNYRMAQQYADSLLKTDILSRETLTTVYGLDALTAFYTYSQQYDQAIKYLPLYKSLAKKLLMKRDEYRADLRSFTADSARGNYPSAIENLRQYFLLKDSLYDVDKTGQLEELKIKYETDEKDQSIAGLKEDSLLQQEKVDRADTIRNITVVGLLVLLLFAGLLYKSYRLNKQNSEAISRKNQELNQLITEKEWLLKEIHHRVKNSLQIVTGLLQRQSAYIDNGEALAAIQNSENRMHAIALIHQKLYQSESLDLISMPEYIEEMVGYLKDSCGLDNRIIFEKHLEAISLDVAQAVPVGLILNEAITNAIKYAYKVNESGTVYVTMVKNEDDCNQLTIADNGPGLPAGLDLEKVDSLGLNLMRGLVKQLGGCLEFNNEMGFTINIIFKTELFSKAVKS